MGKNLSKRETFLTTDCTSQRASLADHIRLVRDHIGDEDAVRGVSPPDQLPPRGARSHFWQ